MSTHKEQLTQQRVLELRKKLDDKDYLGEAVARIAQVLSNELFDEQGESVVRELR